MPEEYTADRRCLFLTSDESAYSRSNECDRLEFPSHAARSEPYNHTSKGKYIHELSTCADALAVVASGRGQIGTPLV